MNVDTPVNLEKAILYVMDLYQQNREMVCEFYWDEVVACEALFKKGVLR